MKKIFLVAVAASLTSAAFSQVKIGGQLTGNLSSAAFDNEEGLSFKKTPAIGFGIGISAEVPLAQKLSLRTSLGLLQKGVKVKLGEIQQGGDLPAGEASLTNKFYYAELPMIVTYNVEQGDKKFFIGAGPSVGFGLFGKSKSAYTVNIPGLPPEAHAEEVDAFKKEEAGFKRFDLSAAAIAGVQWKTGLYVNLGYSLGLSNILPNSEDGGSYKNRGLQLTVGKFFGN